MWKAATTKRSFPRLWDAEILTTGGFDIFRDKRKTWPLRRLAEKHGLIILTDSDAAGFRIRAHIAGAVDPDKITHVYIPDLFGKESRKRRPGAEGKLGVEGIPGRNAACGLPARGCCGGGLGKSGERPQNYYADFAAWGLSGGDGALNAAGEFLGKVDLSA